MAKVILQPAGGPDAREHFEQTVRQHVPLTVLAQFARERDLTNLRKIYDAGGGPVWGVIPGNNTSKWDRIKPGDITLFTGQNQVFAKGIVTYKLHSPGLARHLWGEDSHGHTWEYIYFLKDVSPVNIPYKELNSSAGYDPNYRFPGFNVLDQRRSDNVINCLGLNEAAEADPDDAEEKVIRERTDVEPRTKLQLIRSRRGQGIFKQNVRNYESRCRVTGVDNIKHLRASHIKPWRDSTDKEKLYGCNGLLLAPHVDHLFDEGYISFEDSGAMKVSRQLDPQVLSRWGISLTVNAGSFNNRQRQFLEYHRTNIFKG